MAHFETDFVSNPSSCNRDASYRLSNSGREKKSRLQGSWGWLVRTCVSLGGRVRVVRIHLVSYPRFVVAL